MERTMSLWLFLAEVAGISFAGLALSATPLVVPVKCGVRGKVTIETVSHQEF